MTTALKLGFATGALLLGTASLGCAAQARVDGPAEMAADVTLPEVDCLPTAPLQFRVASGRTYFWCKTMGEAPFVIGTATKSGALLSELRYRERAGGWSGTLRQLGTEHVTVDLTDGEPSRCAIEKAIPARDGATAWVLDTELEYESGVVRRRRRFHEGTLSEEEEVDPEGRRHGVHRQYWETGTLMVEEYFMHGEAHGPYRVLRRDGTWIREEERSEGLRHGVTSVWDRKGTKRFSAMYDHGVLHGECTVWKANGEVLSRRRMDHGDGEFTEVNDDGEVTRSGFRRGNQWDGQFTDFYPSGNLRARGRFLNGKVHGMLVASYETGAARTIAFFLAGTPHGEWKELHESGQPSLVGEIRMTGHLVPHGVWRRFDAKGGLLSEDVYDNGLLRTGRPGECTAHEFRVGDDFRLVDSSSVVPCPSVQVAR